MATFKLSHLSVAFALLLMAIGLFLSLATPFNLFHLKQSETTQIKSVIIIGRHGEVSPKAESYFLGEEPLEELNSLIGQNQLTNIGKERMYLLGKFLKLRYYDRLLQGNPRKISIRSENSDASLESGQSLLAGLNPPRSPNWIWLHDKEFGSQWQPKAIYTTDVSSDDLLSSECNCLKQNPYQGSWKNTSNYAQSLNEFRHDLQTLRQNTGLEFEDDLEMLINIEEALKARSAYSLNNYKSSSSSGGGGAPSWYTSTLANRLSYVANVVTGIRYKSTEVQQLIVGRLLHEILENVFDKIKSDLTANGAKIIGTPAELSHYALDKERMQGGSSGTDSVAANKQQQQQQAQKVGQVIEPNMFIYITDKQHLSALLNSLQIYSNIPNYGSLLIIELHYDPVNQVHFLRLFTVDSPNYNILPEPVRVNSLFCQDTVECSPQKFETNMRHLALKKQAWQQICLGRTQPPSISSLINADNKPTPTPTQPLDARDQQSGNGDSGASSESLHLNDHSNVRPLAVSTQSSTSEHDATSTVSPPPPPPTIQLDESLTSPDVTPPKDQVNNDLEKLDEILLVGPTQLDTPSNSSAPLLKSNNNSNIQPTNQEQQQQQQQFFDERQGNLAPISSNEQQRQLLGDNQNQYQANQNPPQNGGGGEFAITFKSSTNPSKPNQLELPAHVNKANEDNRHTLAMTDIKSDTKDGHALDGRVVEAEPSYYNDMRADEMLANENKEEGERTKSFT